MQPPLVWIRCNKISWTIYSKFCHSTISGNFRFSNCPYFFLLLSSFAQARDQHCCHRTKSIASTRICTTSGITGAKWYSKWQTKNDASANDKRYKWCNRSKCYDHDHRPANNPDRNHSTGHYHNVRARFDQLHQSELFWINRTRMNVRTNYMMAERITRKRKLFKSKKKKKTMR